MKRLLTILCAMLMFCMAVQAEGDFMKNARTIPEELEVVPESYKRPAEQQGTLEKLTYDTWESFTYDQHSQRLTKEAWVYLPYGYDTGKPYHIFYISHGGWSNETTTLGTASRPSELKNIIDHAIQNGKMIPMIIVCPTYNNTSPSDSGDYSLALQLTDQFHNELVNDLIPAVESKYHTYAEYNVTTEGQKASRDYRGFGGFSMGSVNSWHTFQYCLDSFRYFMPMSGNMGDGGWAAQVVQDSDWTDEDFFIWTATGTADFAGSGFTYQIESMSTRYNDVFHLANSEAEGNLSFRLKEGYAHDTIAHNEYIYNALCWFWHMNNYEY